jgi:hypothetical protein
MGARGRVLRVGSEGFGKGTLLVQVRCDYSASINSKTESESALLVRARTRMLGVLLENDERPRALFRLGLCGGSFARPCRSTSLDIRVYLPMLGYFRASPAPHSISSIDTLPNGQACFKSDQIVNDRTFQVF